jgi:DNA polymerase-3 subunit epsilon
VEGRAVVAHNAQHDCKQMRAELRRAGLPDLFAETKNVCTMRKANGHILKAGGKKGWPSLKEVRAFLKLPDDRPHGALSDARDTLEAFRFLRSRGVDLTPEVHYAGDDHPARPKDAPPRPKRPRAKSDDSDGFDDPREETPSNNS